jgi:competence protein ComEC
VSRPAAVALGAVGTAMWLGPGPLPLAAWLAIAGVVAAGVTASWSMAGHRSGAVPVALALGAVAMALRIALGPAALTAPTVLPAGDGPWRATVESVSAPRRGEQPAMLRLDDPRDLRVAATLPRFPAVEPGFQVVVSGSIRPPPDGDPYGDYLRDIGVTGTLRSRALEVQPTHAPALDLERLRRAAAAALTRAIPEPEAGLAAGILVGLRDRVDRDLTAAFTLVGASHVVAISGWNIAIVAASVGALGGRLARRRRSLFTVAAIVAYVAFVGPSPSVVRAAAMAGVVLLARESGRAGRAAAALAWAATAILLIDPALVRDAGFQLSTLATAGLLAWATPLTTRIARLTGGRLPGWLVESLSVSLAAQAATLPVVLASFGRLAIVSPVVNLFVVPLVAPAMAAGAVALAAGALVLAPAVPPVVATLAGLPAWALLAGIIAVVRFGASLPFASLELTPPADTIAAVIVALPLLVIAFRPAAVRTTLAAITRALGFRASSAAAGAAGPPPRSPARTAPHRLPRIAALALAASFVATGLAVAHRPDGKTTIIVLDVGQGDAILVEGSRGGRLLVDGGPDPDRLLVALDERLPPWDRRIDAVVLTHPHEDHVAGLALLLERYRVGRVFEPGMRGPGPGYAAWAARLAGGNVAIGRLSVGDRLTLDDANLEVLWPDPGAVPAEPPDTGTGINNVSIVLLGEARGRRFLLAGDIEEEIDPLLLARGLPRVDVLKVAHHGSRTSSTAAFLDAVRPGVAVVSAGASNPYGHPAPATIERLRQHGSRVFRTDLDGTVEIGIGGDGITVAASGPRRTASLTAVPVRAPIGLFSCGIPAPGAGPVASGG